MGLLEMTAKSRLAMRVEVDLWFLGWLLQSLSGS
jgi:hypothetical protein